MVELGWTADTLAFRLATVAERRLELAEFAAFKEKLLTTIEEPTSSERKLRQTIAHARSIKGYRTLHRIVKRREEPPNVGLVRR
jgi:hypothetical protein